MKISDRYQEMKKKKEGLFTKLKKRMWRSKSKRKSGAGSYSYEQEKSNISGISREKNLKEKNYESKNFEIKNIEIKNIEIKKLEEKEKKSPKVRNIEIDLGNNITLYSQEAKLEELKKEIDDQENSSKKT